jgi:Copper type II ascorbate-dependent monooxygenase, C-terminal domain
MVCPGMMTVAAEDPVPKQSPPTFTKDVAPIIQKKCQGCHRRDQVAPFGLETYEQVRKRAFDIAHVVGERVMPPWKPAPGVGPALKHDQSLSRTEIAILEAWAQAGAPQGDPGHLPPPPAFTVGWMLGTPDLVLEPAESFAVPASGPDIYRCFVIPTNFTRVTYISAIEFQPANRRVVHHINAFLDRSGDARRMDAAEAGPGYTSFSGPGIAFCEELSFWAVGHQASHLPAGVGQRVLRGSDLVLQIHYHPSGKPESDRTRVGLYFSRERVKQALHWSNVANVAFELPAGKPSVEVKANWSIPVDLEVLAVSPHMHQLGRDMRISVTDPKGRTRDLIHIPDWDPSWQNAYHFQERFALRQGSVVKVVAHFDNSEHPRNPDRPPRRVARGFTVTDEMCEGFLAVVKKGQDLTLPGCSDDLAEIFAKQRIRNFMKQQAKRSR